MRFNKTLRPRQPGGKILTTGREGSKFETLFHGKPPCMGPNLAYWAKRHPAGVVRQFGEGLRSQVSFSVRGSKLRCPSTNSSYVASKREIKITKLNFNS
ncbi:hypothetical protein AVEN_122358-1 [Araneus ventricosus]|uniref:Uncharacterized protein n=1 Tax=Araneus ventricosus TaxID=182803 RepID=A0A4Y2SRL4_ARAVE|nr:hypothetical protein AVEN_122358-1 [Araneus ventricosus]